LPRVLSWYSCMCRMLELQVYKLLDRCLTLLAGKLWTEYILQHNCYSLAFTDIQHN
jgi:hypothetical protein